MGMTKKDQVYSFNTGRYYGKDKQPIDWMLVDSPAGQQIAPFWISYYVLFVDRGRGIAGIIPVLMGNYQDLMNNQWVLDQYDAYQYIGSNDAEERIDEALKSQQANTKEHEIDTVLKNMGI